MYVDDTKIKVQNNNQSSVFIFVNDKRVINEK